jgi:hypothetical protein
MTGYVTAVLRRNGKTIQIVKGKNIIPTVGLFAILNHLSNDAVISNASIITYGAVGDGAANPALADIKMENEIDRKAVGVTTVAGTTLTIETFFSEPEGVGTLTKFALFGENATTVADSGTLFEYIKFASAITKTALDTLTVTSELVIANA